MVIYRYRFERHGYQMMCPNKNNTQAPLEEWDVLHWCSIGFGTPDDSSEASFRAVQFYQI